jgi:transcriptional regulator with XRE-family HTH domain
MKERILHLMQTEQLNPEEFATRLGINRSGISHFISGRNKPSREFIEKVLRAFPSLNARWFVLGEGAPYTPSSSSPPSPLGDSAVVAGKKATAGKAAQSVASFDFSRTDRNGVQSTNAATGTNSAERASSPQTVGSNRIEQMVMFYEDGTFRRYVDGRYVD